MLVRAVVPPCPHTMYPALRTVAVTALVAGVYAGVAALYGRAVAGSGIAVAGGLIGMLPVLGE